MDDKLKKIYATFDPAPLRAGQQDLYVNLDSVRGDLPLTSAALRRCREDSVRSYRRQLRPDHWPL